MGRGSLARPPIRGERTHLPDIDTARAWKGRTIVDRDGSPVGSINAIYSGAEERQLWRHCGLAYDTAEASRASVSDAFGRTVKREDTGVVRAGRQGEPVWYRASDRERLVCRVGG